MLKKKKIYIRYFFKRKVSPVFSLIFLARPVYYSGLVSLLSGNLFVFVCSPFTILISLFNFCSYSSTVIFIMNLLAPVCSPFINLRSFSISPHAPVPQFFLLKKILSFRLALNLPSFEFIHIVISRRRRSVTENENYKSEINVFRSRLQLIELDRFQFEFKTLFYSLSALNQNSLLQGG